MKLARRRFLQLAAGAAALPVAAPAVLAQSSSGPSSTPWPSRVVRLVVGFPPGGGADAAARIVANRLSEMWGQQVVVENKGGAGGNVANETVAAAPGDGYTMLFAVPGIAINRFLFPSLTYDAASDLAPVSLIGTYPTLLVVAGDSPIKTAQQYIAEARANPGKVTYASPGVGTTGHLSAELLKQMAKIDLIHVPYRGVAAGAMSDLIAGRVDAMLNTTGSLLQAAKSGQVRALAVTTAERFPGAPEIPTFAEVGVPGFDVTSWYALFVPAKTPPEIVQRMNTAAVAMLQEPAIKTRFEPLGITAVGSTSAAMAARMRADAELWGPIIKAANIKGDCTVASRPHAKENSSSHHLTDAAQRWVSRCLPSPTVSNSSRPSSATTPIVRSAWLIGVCGQGRS
jgi:tripartite-type tricarboxylate transporter receptor subunit TctC